MSVVHGTELEGVEEVFGIKRIRSVEVRIAFDELVTAKIEFLMDEIQAKAFLQLCKDGKWRSPPATASGDAVDTTSMNSTSKYRTYSPAK